MGRALSGDLRSRVLKASAEGMSARKAAARFGVGCPARSAGLHGPGWASWRHARKAVVALPASMHMKPSSSA